MFKTNGKPALQIANSKLSLFNWKHAGEDIGGLVSLLKGADGEKAICSLWNDVDGAVSISYREPNGGVNSDAYPSYIEFDKYNRLGNLNTITVREQIGMLNNMLYFGLENDQRIYSSSDKELIFQTKSGARFIDKDSSGTTHYLDTTQTMFSHWNKNTYYAKFSENQFALVGNGHTYMWKNSNSDVVGIDGGLTVNKHLDVLGNLYVKGNKNCLQTTKEYGDVPFYANEDINSLLTKTPIDEYTFTELNPHTGRYIAIIRHSQLIRDCINTDMDYNVWITKYGRGDIWVANTYPGYVVIESDIPVKFKYKLEGRRKNFEEEGEAKTLRKFML